MRKRKEREQGGEKTRGGVRKRSGEEGRGRGRKPQNKLRKVSWEKLQGWMGFAKAEVH